MKKRRVHILGVCGTFMGGVAALAKAAGFQVSGCDLNVYPPMSTQLESLGITLYSGYGEANLPKEASQIIVGNALSRSNPSIEYMLNQGLSFTSGPQWVAENVLQDKWVLAVAGTHGKTTTSSILAWILEYAGLNPGFLIGGVPSNFGVTARLTDSRFFVIEADEYDSAFFDKRSKFVHYGPRTLILNNLEFDHADIFEDLAAIQKQFHHLVRTVPGEGLIVWNQDSQALADTLTLGCWSKTETFGQDSATQHWSTKLTKEGNSSLYFNDEALGQIRWNQLGNHNVQNAVAAVAAARHAGVPVALSLEALSEFTGVSRRLEQIGSANNVILYDDFAHHPTAVAATLSALRDQWPKNRLITLLEPRSNTMRMEHHGQTLVDALDQSDRVMVFLPPDLRWRTSFNDETTSIHRSVDDLVAVCEKEFRQGDRVVIMSNGGFGGIHQQLLELLQSV